MGAITPLGHSVARRCSRRSCAGKSGVGPITHFNARRFPTTFAAEVKDFDLAQVHVPTAAAGRTPASTAASPPPPPSKRSTDAGLLDDSASVDRTRFGIYLGSGEGIQDFPQSDVAHRPGVSRRGPHAVDDPAFERGGLQRFHRRPAKSEQELHTTSAHLAAHFDLEGPNYNCLTACAASSQAVGEAAELIRHGDADLMLAGGSHSMIHPFGVTGFNLLTALSTRNEAPQKASRPFDLHRDGFVLGEGAGMLVLEELEHAQQRGATHLRRDDRLRLDRRCLPRDRQPSRGPRRHRLHPGRRSRTAACQPADIGYINAHGTSTKVNDRWRRWRSRKCSATAPTRCR